VERLGDITGYIYEDLIPAEERHQMGQFYTPQPIAELIARWCINGNPGPHTRPWLWKRNVRGRGLLALIPIKDRQERGAFPPGRRFTRASSNRSTP